MPSETSITQPAARRESPIAIAALVAGALSLTGLGFLAGIPAIVLALVGLKQKASGRRFLIGGLITGILGTLLGLFLLIFFFWVVSLDNSQHQMPYPYDSPYTPNEQPFETTKV